MVGSQLKHEKLETSSWRIEVQGWRRLHGSMWPAKLTEPLCWVNRSSEVLFPRW